MNGFIEIWIDLHNNELLMCERFACSLKVSDISAIYETKNDKNKEVKTIVLCNGDAFNCYNSLLDIKKQIKDNSLKVLN